jgi:hypothetical protein
VRGLLIGIGIAVAAWLVAVLALVALGRRSQAREFAKLIPNVLVLFRGLLSDPRVPRGAKLAHGLPHANERALSWLLGGRDGRLLLVTIFGILRQPLAGLGAIMATSLLTLSLRLLAVRRLSA